MPGANHRRSVLGAALWAASVAWACSPDARSPAPASPAPTAAPKPTAEAPGPTCPRGWGACEQRAAGCATDLARTPTDCGACGTRCGASETCVAGRCRTGVAGIAAGGSHSCLWSTDGELACWGLNGLGQLGLKGRSVRSAPVVVEAIAGVVEVAAGRDYTCVRDREGALRCFGEAGALGQERARGGPAPATPAITGASALDAAPRHACAVAGDGEVLCWGSNVATQLGFVNAEDDDPHAIEPREVEGAGPAIAVVTGDAHTCAVTPDRRLRCWGDNRHGQLGDGGREPREGVVEVSALSGVARVDLGAFHGCATTRDGGLHCWGRNEAGQLGAGDREDRPTPTALSLTDVTDVSAGPRHTCAIARGELWCWGENADGQLGIAAGDDVMSPQEVEGVAEPIAVAAGERHTCALTAKGEVWCFGLNDGQLGDGSTEAREGPVRVIWPPVEDGGESEGTKEKRGKK